ncbi:MAG: glycosyltransferase family 4 protein [Anaerolineae bacterium]|nr:glycosyltransferase family 4 protein [Gloeobacterales cyanobacterium ES-bin-313]
MIAVNGRYLLKTRISGVERYAQEVIKRIGETLPLTLLTPKKRSTAYEHFWEQCLLPLSLKDRPLLFNPCNLAPVLYSRNVVVLHDIIPLVYPEFYSFGFRSYYGFLLPLIAQRAIHIVTVSKFSKQEIIRCLGICEKKISVVYSGVSQRFHPNQVLPPKYNFDRPYILYTGSLEPRKDVGTLVRAFDFARKNGHLQDHCLIVAGNPHKNFSQLDFSPESTNDIFFLGYVDDHDLPALYANAELFVYPSLYEGFGLPVLEAMASGTVPLVSDSSSLVEIVRRKDLRFPPGNYKMLAQRICDLIADPLAYQQLRQECLQFSSQFSWSETARNTAKILTGIV